MRPFATHIRQRVREREILRVAATFRAGDGRPAADQARTEILRWAQKRTGDRLPAEAWEFSEFEHPIAGRHCTAVRIENNDGDIWALRTNDPDKHVPQRTWTTETVVGVFNAKTYFSLRLIMSSPESEPLLAPAVPGLVRQVASKCRLYQGKDLVDTEPLIVAKEAEVEVLIADLTDTARRIPIVVLTPPDDSTSPTVPHLSATVLARATIGLARVVVLPTQLTWALTNRFGRRLSVYNGAARLYRSGFTDDADPYSHELFLVEKSLEDVTGILASLQRLIARESLRQFHLGRDVLPYASVRDRCHEWKREALERAGATDQARLSAAQGQVESLKESLRDAEKDNEWYVEEHDRAQDRARIAETQLRASISRVQQLTHQLKSRGDDLDSDIPQVDSWTVFSDWCDEHLVGRVVLSSRARREIRAAKFGDVAAAARCLLWLANYYREQRSNGGDGDLRGPIESGIQNDRCGADSFWMEWQEQRICVQWHIKNGGNTRDPSRCLRIYYFWDDISQRVVIASMPSHIRTGAT